MTQRLRHRQRDKETKRQKDNKETKRDLWIIQHRLNQLIDQVIVQEDGGSECGAPVLSDEAAEAAAGACLGVLSTLLSSVQLGQTDVARILRLHLITEVGNLCVIITQTFTHSHIHTHTHKIPTLTQQSW